MRFCGGSGITIAGGWTRPTLLRGAQHSQLTLLPEDQGSLPATAMIFVPLPRFVFPTFDPPFFGRCKTAIDESFTDIEPTLNPQIVS